MTLAINTSLNLLATSLLIGQPPSPDPQQGQRTGNLIDGILRETDQMLRSGQTSQTPSSTTGGSTTTTTTTSSAPTPQDIERIATQNRTWFGIQSRNENGRTVFFHPTYGRCIQQLDGSYFFPEPTTEGQRTQPFTIHNRQVINNSRPLPGTISINHFNLSPLNNWIFTDSEGSVHFLQRDGTFWDLGVRTNGTRVRNQRIIRGTQVIEGRPQPLSWTLGMAQLGLYPVQNSDGSFSRPGDNRKYFLQTDGTIFRQGYTNTDGVQVLGSTYINNNGTLQWDSNRSQPLPSTYTIARLNLTPNDSFRFPFFSNSLNAHCVLLNDNQTVIFVRSETGRASTDGHQRVFIRDIRAARVTQDTINWTNLSHCIETLNAMGDLPPIPRRDGSWYNPFFSAPFQSHMEVFHLQPDGTVRREVLDENQRPVANQGGIFYVQNGRLRFNPQ